MRIKFANIFLSNGGLEGPSGLTVNGEQVVDEAQFFRALAATYYARGNDSTEVGFTVSREHGSHKLASVFMLMHRRNVPKEGDLIVYCGDPGDEQQVALIGAVLVSSGASFEGVSSTTTYTIRGGLPQTDEIPDGEEVDPEVTRRGTVAIANGATSVSVAFTLMTSAPYVVATVYAPNGGDNIFATVVKSSITSTGFDVTLSGPVPDGNYELGYIAIL